VPGVIRLYRAHWSTNCERVALALAHKRLDVESVIIDYSDRSAVERVSGQPLVPVIDDDGEVVADSRAILRDLERRYPQHPLFPDADPERSEVDLFLEWFDEVWKQAANRIEGELDGGSPDAAVIESCSSRMGAWLDMFEGLLAGRSFMVGDWITAADFIAFPFLKYARGRDPNDDELYHRVVDEHQNVDGRPRLAAWIERVDALPRAYGPAVSDATADR
jgi:glutathione S-transferase